MMRKAAAVVLTTGLLLGTVAFGAMAKGRNVKDEQSQKLGKVSCCEQEQREAETAPWDKPTTKEKAKAEDCNCCRKDEAGNPAPTLKKVQRCEADEPGGKDPGAEGCGMDREQPRCGEGCYRDEAANLLPPMKRVYCHGAADPRREGPGPGGERCCRDEAGNPPPPMKRVHCHGAADLWREGPGPGEERCGEGCRGDEYGNPPAPMQTERRCRMEGGWQEGPEPIDRERVSLNERQKAEDGKPTSQMNPLHTCKPKCSTILNESAMVPSKSKTMDLISSVISVNHLHPLCSNLFLLLNYVFPF